MDALLDKRGCIALRSDVPRVSIITLARETATTTYTSLSVPPILYFMSPRSLLTSSLTGTATTSGTTSGCLISGLAVVAGATDVTVAES
jgi:hypothetical protein